MNDSSMIAGTVEVIKSNGVATLSLKSPGRLNALSLEMYRQFPSICAKLNADPEVRVAVLRGHGTKAFSAGADISEFERYRADAISAKVYNSAVEEAEAAFAALHMPTIASIAGYCMGGGTGLALACDIRLAAENAVFAITSAKIGLVYSFESTKRLVDVVGSSHAMWVLCSGERVTAQDAMRIGLVNHVFSEDSVFDEAYRLADVIASRARSSVAAAKSFVSSMRRGQVSPTDGDKEMEMDSFDSKDYLEGVRSFLERRQPNFD